MKTSQVEDKKLPPEPEYYTWEKGFDMDLSKHFASPEFECHCKFPECKEQRISSDLINRIEKLRIEINQPLYVTSAYRCSRYQQVLTSSGIQTAKGKSQHELGNAVDVAPKDGNIEPLLVSADKLFDSVGIASNFLHLDTRTKKEDGSKRRWKY